MNKTKKMKTHYERKNRLTKLLLTSLMMIITIAVVYFTEKDFLYSFFTIVMWIIIVIVFQKDLRGKD